MKKDDRKTKSGLIAELNNLRQQVAKLQGISKSEVSNNTPSLQTLVDALPVFVSYVDCNHYYKFVNRRYEQWLNKPKEQIVGQHLSTIVGEEGYAQAKPYLDKAFSGLPVSYEVTLQEQDGLHVYNVQHTPDSSLGITQGVFVLVTDITEPVDAQNQLREERNLLKSVFSATPDFLVYKDKDFIYRSVNPAFCKFLHKKESDIIGKTDYDLFPEDEAKIYREYDALVIKTGETFQRDELVSMSGGDKAWLQVAKNQVRDDCGEVSGVLVTVRDISERKYAELALIQSEERLSYAKDEAEAANEAKSKFLTRMSHEFRTPLNVILGYIQLSELIKTEPIGPQLKEYLSQAQKAGWHMMQLVKDLLDLAAIEANKVEFHIETVDLYEQLQDALVLVESLVKQRDISVENNVAESECQFVQADPIRLKQVLLNLLSNAVRYNREGGKIIVSCEKISKDSVRISITDTGSGIAEKYLPTLFEAFSPLYLKAYGTEGVGIGLNISKLLIESMGGQIGVNTKIGEGSSFWIELYLIPEKEGEVTPAGIPAEDANPDLPQADSVTADASILQRLDKSKYKILCVEDNPLNLLLMKDLLEDFQIIEAITGEESVALAQEQSPDLILMDISLPGISGIEAMQQIRSIKETEKIPVIAISGNALQSDIDYAIKCGFDDYLTKPIKVEELLQKINYFLSQE